MVRYGLLLLLCFTTAMSYKVAGQEQEQGDERSMRSKRASDADTSQNVIIKKFSLLVEGRKEVFVDLTQPAEDIQRVTLPIKEGSEYQIKIYYLVQREIVSGLRYHQTLSRKGIRVDKMSWMIGSKGPQSELQTYVTPAEESPKGFMKRGVYKVKSHVIDDDRNAIFDWEWNLAVNKYW